MQDPRWFFVDTETFPRTDGIHLTTLSNDAANSPNTGTERFARAVSRLAKRADALSRLPVDARMIAMRAIDAGMEMTPDQMQACVDFTATPGFSNLRMLVVPQLTATNSFDQTALRRCNLLLHLGGMEPVGFLPVAPVVCTATYVPGVDASKLETAIQTLLKAWGVQGLVNLSQVTA